MGKKRDNVRWTAVSVSCVFLRSLHGKLSTSAPPRVDVCVQSGSGKRSGSVSKPALFFPPLVPIDIHEPVGGEMWNVHQGWAYRTLRVWPTFSILFRGEFSVSRIFIIHRAVRVSFFSRVLYRGRRAGCPRTYIFLHVFFFPLPCTTSTFRRCPIKKRILLCEHIVTSRKVVPRQYIYICEYFLGSI